MAWLIYISVFRYALIVFGKQKDCEEALYKNLNKSKMMVKLGLASRNRNRKDEPGW